MCMRPDVVASSMTSQYSESSHALSAAMDEHLVGCRDIRGLRADEVASVIDEAVASNPSGSSIFIVHGMGTGRLRAEVHRVMKQHSQITRFALDEPSGGGCTMAVIR